jgi:hypothetical protein
MPKSAHEEALGRIVWLAREWSANRLGGVAIQRKRWETLAEIAGAALAPSEPTPEINDRPAPKGRTCLSHD